MDVQVSFYGSLKRFAGGRTRTVRVPGGQPTVGDLRAAIARDLPGIAPHLRLAAVGIGTELFPDHAVLQLDQEISVLPPVSGGSESPRLQRAPLSLDALLLETSGVDAGALVVFAGTVRAVDGSEEIAALEYDVHEPMAEKAIRGIEREIIGRPGVLACRIAHRVGKVPAGEPSVYVVVRARHRPEAFEAARAGIDRVKAEAPIWKEDLHPDGRRTAHTGADSTPLASTLEGSVPSRNPNAKEGG